MLMLIKNSYKIIISIGVSITNGWILSRKFLVMQRYTWIIYFFGSLASYNLAFRSLGCPLESCVATIGIHFSISNVFNLAP